MQAVGARQVQQAQGFTGCSGVFAFFAFNGNARVIAYFLAATGQQVKQCGFAAVGVAGQRYQWAARMDMDGGGVHAVS